MRLMSKTVKNKEYLNVLLHIVSKQLCELMKVTKEELTAKGKTTVQATDARRIFSFELKRRNVRHQDIADFLNINVSSISIYAKTYIDLFKYNPTFKVEANKAADKIRLRLAESTIKKMQVCYTRNGQQIETRWKDQIPEHDKGDGIIVGDKMEFSEVKDIVCWINGEQLSYSDYVNEWLYCRIHKEDESKSFKLEYLMGEKIMPVCSSSR